MCSLIKTFLIILVVLCYSIIGAICQNNFDSTDLKKANAQLGKIDVIEGDNQKNIPVLKKLLKTYESLSAWEEYIDCMSYLSTAYYYEKEYANFFLIAPKLVDEAKEKLGEVSEGYIDGLSHLALLHILKGNYRKSIEIQKHSLDLLKKNFPKGNQSYPYEALGLSYVDMGDYDEANNYYFEALKYVERNDDNGEHTVARIYRQIGNSYLKNEKDDDAYKYLFKSIERLEALPVVPYFDQTRWYAYQNIAKYYNRNKSLDSAFYFINKALVVQKRILRQKGVLPLEAYKSYLQLGSIHLKTNNIEKASEAFGTAYGLAEDEYSSLKKHPSLAICKAKTAAVYHKKNDCLKALAIYQEALQLISVDFGSNGFSDNPGVEQYIIKREGLDVLAEKAATLFDCYKNKNNETYLLSAYKTYQSAAVLIRSIRQDYLTDGSKHVLAKSAIPIYEKAIEVSLELNRVTGDNKYLESAFAFAENNKAILLFESIKNDMAKGMAGIPDSLLDKEREFSSELAFYRKLIKEEEQKNIGIDEGKIKEWEQQVFGFNGKYQRLVKKLETEYPSYYDIKYQTQTTSVADIQSQLPSSNTALIEYMLGEKNGFVFLITKNDLKIFKIKERKQLIESIAALRPLVNLPPNSENFGNDFLEFTNISSNIYENILAETINKLPDNIDRLVIVPDDVLTYLPFELILTKKPKNKKPDYSPKNLDYLFERYDFHYQYSASLMTADKARGRENKNAGNFIGFAPTFEGGFSATRACTEEGLYSLQCNQNEVKSIQEIMGGEVLLANIAGVDNFIKNAANYRILHLATHACVDDSDIGLNKIYLSDGDLSQFELNNMNLNAELPVLSACNTGMGQLLKGEGMMSLTRSFMMAGSKSVLTSLWSVDDCATSDIMVNYYKCLKKGMPKDEAIAEAKLTYLKDADRNGSHPYYWAAFVQFGEVEAISNLSINFYYFLIAGLGIAFLLFWYFKGRWLYG